MSSLLRLEGTPALKRFLRLLRSACLQSMLESLGCCQILVLLLPPLSTDASIEALHVSLCLPCVCCVGVPPVLTWRLQRALPQLRRERARARQPRQRMRARLLLQREWCHSWTPRPPLKPPRTALKHPRRHFVPAQAGHKLGGCTPRPARVHPWTYGGAPPDQKPRVHG